MFKVLQTFVLLILFIHSSSPQENIKFRDMFLEAESYFLYEEYSEALPLYMQLSRQFPGNDYISYKIGRCYLNIPFEKEKSVKFLQKASQNMDPGFKKARLNHQAAPPDAIFYLGDAFRINNQLEKAIEKYETFRKSLKSRFLNYSMVDEQIRSCRNAMILEKQPLEVIYTNLGDTVNTHFSENNAIVSGDDSILIFYARLRFYPAVFYSHKENGVWSVPENINPNLGIDEDCFPVGISYNGKELLLYRNNDYLGDLFVSRLVNGRWSKIKKLNNHINTNYLESHACLTRDGLTLYFTSNRRGGYGGLDIYMSTRNDISTDNWGSPVNLGPVVNSPLNEETPFVLPDGRRLYFSSQGHHNMGGYDIFFSQKDENGSWSEPRNLGFPVNTTDNDIFFYPVHDGSEAYMALHRKGTYGLNDIYKLKILSEGLYLLPGSLPEKTITISEQDGTK